MWLLDHQELPLDKVLTALELPRNLGENPLYQVMFTYRPLDVDALAFGGGPCAFWTRRVEPLKWI